LFFNRLDLVIVDLRNIAEEPRYFSFTLEKEWWQSERDTDHILGFERPLEADIEIYRVGDKHLLKGAIKGRVTVRCDRCLEPYWLDSRSHFETFFQSPVNEAEDDERELEEEDMEVDFEKGVEIDLREILREQIYLSLPVKLICHPDCRGLCPQCGINLNEGQCRCTEELGHPGFAKLKSLKIQGE
jgi:uncharacterized protein